MGYTLRQFNTEGKFSQALTFDALKRAVPLDTIKDVLSQEGVKEQRERKLHMVVTVLVVIAMHLYSQLALHHVMRKIVQGLRFVWQEPTYALPKASTLTYRRYQLGGRHHSSRDQGAFPQVQSVYLAECGTHAIVNAGFWPCHTSERVGGFRMVRSLTPGMLLM
jgi:hypothetical protein